ncbi:MAG: trypsin-like peptidase domain-containing protein [Actinomycetes bacterium]|jgi:putative serine protease PepD|nr:MAG: hypothetical protein DIU60_04480 [Actinomycetota bacterium]
MTDETRDGREDAPVRTENGGSGATSENGTERRGRPEFFPAEDGPPITRETPRWEGLGEQAGQPPQGPQPNAPQHGPQGPQDRPLGGEAPPPAPWQEPGGQDRPGTGPGAPATGPVPGPGGPPVTFTPPPPQNALGMGPGWAPPPPSGGRPGGLRGVPSLGLLVVIAVVIALVAGGFGGVGGYLLAKRDSEAVTDPSYTIEAAPSGNVNRDPQSVAGVAARVLPSVVSLEVRGVTEGGTGSGFIIQGGYVVTNNHVVAPAGRFGQITVSFNNGKTSPAKLVGRDPSSDIAVVKPENLYGMPTITLGDSDSVVVGDPVIAIGAPLGLTGTVTTGIVSAVNRPVQAGGEGGSDVAWINAIQTDAAINPGNSGGPLVNASGQVIGVNSAIASLGGGSQSGNIGLGFAIPSNQVRRIAQELINTGVAKTPRIGITIDQTYSGEGVRIATGAFQGQEPVEKGGPADKAGLKPGDVILAIDGKPMLSGDQLIVTIRSKAPGDKIKVTYRRDGEEKTTTVEVGATVPNPQPS